VLAAAVPRVASAQHITIDGRFSAPRTLSGPYYDIGANLGRQIGGNLFHSFGKFGLVSGETAGFSGPPTVSNVIGRVTGRNPSSVDGTIKSNIAGANLFLINPSGMVFGPNARVNVSGSFHASTADYLKMSDGAKFQATNPDGSTLSAAPPAAFGFLAASPAAITVNGSTLGLVAGKTLGLVGGPVSIAPDPQTSSGARLSAPAGTIHVTSAAGTGEVPVDPRERSTLTVSKFGAVDIKGGATPSVLTASNLSGNGGGGSVFIRSDTLSIDASVIAANNSGSEPGGQLVLRGDTHVTLSNRTMVQAVTLGSGSGAEVQVSTAPNGAISAYASTVEVGVRSSGTGNAGQLSLVTGQLVLTHGAQLTSNAQGSGKGGPIAISANSVVLDGEAAASQSTGIFSSASAAGAGGSICIIAGELSVQNGAAVLAQSLSNAAGGGLDVKVGGPLTVNSGSAALVTAASGGGNAGNVSVTAAGPVTIDVAVAPGTMLSGIGSLTLGDANAGDVAVSAANVLSINNAAGIQSLTVGRGNAGKVTINAESLSIINGGAIGSSTLKGAGSGGDVSVNASGMLSVAGNGQPLTTGIFTLSRTPNTDNAGQVVGNAGTVIVNARTLSIVNGGEIGSETFASGKAGGVTVSVAGGLTIDGTTTPSSSFTGIASRSEKGSTGSAGSVTVTAGNLHIGNGGLISTSTFASGEAGSVTVRVADKLTIDGTMESPDSSTGIYSQANGTSTGNAGDLTVDAGSLYILNRGAISSSTFAPGNAGNITVSVVGGLTIDGTMAPSSFTGIASQADVGSAGNAGIVTVSAGGAIAILNGGRVSSATLRSGDGGTVSVRAQGALTLSGPTSRILASSSSDASGKAGSVIVSAAQIALMSGASISSTTAGTGEGGSVDVMTPGALVLDGQGVAGTQIAASATGAQSGAGGPVTVTAGSLSVTGGAQIASSTAGPGNGGPITVKVTSDIVLPDPGQQITAQSTGSGDAGSITVSAVRLLMSNGSAISTQASTADGGNIRLNVSDLVYLLSSKITASVNTETGNGGNITIDPQLVVLNHSRITATAAEGRGGNITINAGAFIPSADSMVDASSQKGISGTVLITNPRVDVNGALVVLSSELRAHAAVLRAACAARADRPVSSLVEAGRGGLPQDPEATLPALYIADRDVNTNPGPGIGTNATGDAPLRTTVRLTMPCR
jgi:filamentous hemagglutinin family protein